MTDNELLKFAIENGIIDVSSVQSQIEMKRRKDLLEKHKWSVWEKDGSWYTYLPDREKGRVKKKRKNKCDIEDLIIEYYENEETRVYFRDVFKMWADEKLELGEIKKQSYDKYCSDFERFFPEDSWFCQIVFGDITESDLTRFIKCTIKDKKLSQKAYNGFRLIIRGVFKHAKTLGLTEISMTNFFGDLELSSTLFTKKANKPNEQIFFEDEIPRIASYLRNNPTIWNLGLLLQFETGLRIGELAALKHSDIKGNKIYVRRTEVKKKDENGKWKCVVEEDTKTEAGERFLIVSDMALCTLAQIARINPHGEYLFQNEKGDRIRENTFNKRLDSVCRELRIPHRSTHKVRRTYSTTLFNNSVSEALVATQMGHKDIATTKKFYYFDNRRSSAKENQINKAIDF